ncbi:hypothetical protein ACCO45_000301 [Purpureocillium lilacinum]|uniref:Uncharacterized protein n=1 Tax=Purpureocillium lilacinum TaxID=33203 RepID=A0ACC4E4U1_PURLI
MREPWGSILCHRLPPVVEESRLSQSVKRVYTLRLRGPGGAPVYLRYPPSDRLAAPVRSSGGTQGNKRRCVLACKPQTLIWETLSHRRDVNVALLQPDLEVTVGATPRQLVMDPVGGEAGCRYAVLGRLRVMRKSGVVGLEEVIQELVSLRRLGELSGLGGQKARLLAKHVKEQGRMRSLGTEASQLDHFLVPPMRIRVRRVVGRQPLDKPLDFAVVKPLGRARRLSESLCIPKPNQST